MAHILTGCRPAGAWLALLLWLWALPAPAAEVQVIGLGENFAILVIDGGKPRTLRAGQASPEGVKLISADGKAAVVEMDGQRQTLTMGQAVAGSPAESANPKVVLTADAKGHFFTTAVINGGSVKVLVDTGATSVMLRNSDARRLGINYLAGERGVVNTANGIAPVYKVKASVKVGGILLHNVDVVVEEADAVPFGLLGMSFLNRVEMKRDGSTMTLIKRF